jgi:hypothetical protein
VITATVTIRDSSDKLRRAVDRGVERVHSRAGAYMRTTAARKIRRGRERKRAKPARVPSKPGTAPKTWVRGGLRDAMRFAGDPMRRRVVVGPIASMVGRVGKAHELGGRYRGQTYPRRPFMRPALETTADRIEVWYRDSIKR